MFGLFYPYGFVLQAIAILHFVRRRPESYWLFIILMGGAVGALAYIVIEVVPDGQMKEQVANNQLAGKTTHTLTIPHNAIPDASKLMVKVYPGVFSQVLEGVEGLIRLPGG